MDFKLDFTIPPSELDLSLDSKFIFMGSCFADNISDKMIGLGLPVIQNPFGTLFHPDPIADQLLCALSDSEELYVLRRDDVYLEWMSAGKLAADSEEGLISLVLNTRKELKQRLAESKVLVISFGTAWGYRNLELETIVGNCHKQPSSSFKKELFDLGEMVDKWSHLIEMLNKFNPELKVIFTVSPVRHIKDGLIENNRSKARLIELVHSLIDRTNTIYFPAYEILIDELRDYRFYDEDLIHPNLLSIDYIWEKFQEFIFSNNAKADLKEIIRFIKSRDHRSLHSFSSADKQRINRVEKDLLQLRERFPWLCI